jgi:hypothetical protein
MLKQWLEMSGAQVTAMASAWEALKTLDDSTPEVLLSDPACLAWMAIQ